MKEYHKIQSIFKRDEKSHKFIRGAWTTPEFEYLKDNLWTFTEKVDGTNIRVMWDGENVTFGGRTERASIPTFLLNSLLERFATIQARLRLKEVFDCPVCLYGEGYGAKIQKGGGDYKADGTDFVLFDARIGRWWLKREDLFGIAKALEIGIVPIIDKGTIQDAVNIVEAGLKSQWGDFTAEGLVLRPCTELNDRAGRRIITKLKHKDFPVAKEKEYGYRIGY